MRVGVNKKYFLNRYEIHVSPPMRYESQILLSVKQLTFSLPCTKWRVTWYCAAKPPCSSLNIHINWPHFADNKHKLPSMTKISVASYKLVSYIIEQSGKLHYCFKDFWTITHTNRGWHISTVLLIYTWQFLELKLYFYPSLQQDSVFLHVLVNFRRFQLPSTLCCATVAPLSRTPCHMYITFYINIPYSYNT